MVDTEAYYSMKEHIDLKPNLGVIGDTTAYGVPECLCSVSLNSKQSSIHPKKSKLSSYDDVILRQKRLLQNTNLLSALYQSVSMSLKLDSGWIETDVY